jgi:timeless
VVFLRALFFYFLILTFTSIESCVISVIEEQIKLRDNAIAQANLLTEYKKMIVYHPSHRQKKSKKQSKGGDDGAKGLLSVFVSLLTEPLSRTGMARTNEDHLLVEVILHLFRNLLCAGEPLFKDSNNVQESTKLHQELIALFEKEMVLDILLVIGQEMESRENTQYNLLLMEILHHLLKSQVRCLSVMAEIYVYAHY